MGVLSLDLPLCGGTDRRWRVGHDSGDTFTEGDEFDGLALTLELKTPEEARAVADYLLRLPGTHACAGDQL